MSRPTLPARCELPAQRQPPRRALAPVERQIPAAARPASRRLGFLGGPTGAAIFLMALSEPVCAFASRQFDHAARVQDDLHQLVWVSNGHSSQNLRYVFIALALALGLHGVATSGLNPLRASKNSLSGFAVALLALAGWNIVAHVGQDTGPFLIATSCLTFVLLACVVLAPPTPELIRALAVLLGAVCVTVLAYRAYAPDLAANACRAKDGKCGITGVLLEGYFPQENFLAIVVTLLSPTIAFLRKTRSQLLVGALAVLVALETGSRVSELSLVVTAFGVVWMTRARRHGGELRPPALLRWLPIAALTLSLYVFEEFSGGRLTGRGVIYDAVRSQLHGVANVIGAGPNDLFVAYSSGQGLSFLPTHEHGQAPHLVGRTGYVGLALFAIALLCLLRRRGAWPASRAFTAIILASASTQFVTESVWKFDLRDDNFWSLLLFAACACAPVTRLLGSRPDPRAHARLGARVDPRAHARLDARVDPRAHARVDARVEQVDLEVVPLATHTKRHNF